MKFGGTSVGDSDRIGDVAKIVVAAQKQARIVVVVSAMAKVTDLLLAVAHSATTKHQSALEAGLEHLRTLHLTTAVKLELPSAAEAKLMAAIEVKLTELENILHSIFALGELTPRALDLIVSFGERLSIELVAAAITKHGATAIPVEANQLVVTTADFGDARPLLPESAAKAKPILSKLAGQNTIPVVTGFMGATAGGITTTLGRGGSDYSATILGYCVDAAEVWIWTDVDGVMTADPRIIKTARTISELSYVEAAELSYFGAKVLHPLTMVPASLKNIPIRIKNTFNPDNPGTVISEHTSAPEHAEKAISTTKKLALITVQGRGMVGVPGMAAKVFSAIAAHHINVLFISQASSEYNISLAVRAADGADTVKLLREVFAPEQAANYIDQINMEEGLAIVAVIGEGMKGSPGVAGRIFAAMGHAGVNIFAIAQGSSEHNISFIITESDIPRAVQSLHDELHLVTQ